MGFVDRMPVIDRYVAFHFVASADVDGLRHTITAIFPDLAFEVYPFHDTAVTGLIFTSIHSTLDCPLNYAHSYLADLLPAWVRHVVYLDSDLVLVNDIAALAGTPSQTELHLDMYDSNEKLSDAVNGLFRGLIVGFPHHLNKLIAEFGNQSG